jgi:hypothetical protein
MGPVVRNEFVQRRKFCGAWQKVARRRSNAVQNCKRFVAKTKRRARWKPNRDEGQTASNNSGWCGLENVSAGCANDLGQPHSQVLLLASKLPTGQGSKFEMWRRTAGKFRSEGQTPCWN